MAKQTYLLWASPYICADTKILGSLPKWPQACFGELSLVHDSHNWILDLRIEEAVARLYEVALGKAGWQAESLLWGAE